MSLLAEHLFNKRSRERLREDIRRIGEEGRRELKKLLAIQHEKLKPLKRKS